MTNLRDFQDNLSKMVTGMTKSEALEKKICIECKRPDPLARCKTELGRREYFISGMCEECFDKLFAEPDEELEP